MNRKTLLIAGIVVIVAAVICIVLVLAGGSSITADTPVYENGVLKFEIPYTNDLINGVYKEYFENANLKEENTYIEGVLMSYKEYDKNGQLMYKRIIKN